MIFQFRAKVFALQRITHMHIDNQAFSDWVQHTPIDQNFRAIERHIGLMETHPDIAKMLEEVVKDEIEVSYSYIRAGVVVLAKVPLDDVARQYQEIATKRLVEIST